MLNILIINGDMNAQIAKDENNKFCLHKSSNRNGKYQADFTSENRIGCLNIKFKKRRENYEPISTQITLKHS